LITCRRSQLARPAARVFRPVSTCATFIAAEKLGPDALDRRFNFVSFKTAELGRKRDVKSVMLDQQVLAGIGNICSDQILFQARIKPVARIDKLAPSRLKRLFLQMCKVLTTAVRRGAGSEQFVDRMPKTSLLPQRKTTGRCPRCRSLLKVFKVGGHTAYCCSRCQGR
jgi:formamidopyrimidine-DNA glycosylase